MPDDRRGSEPHQSHVERSLTCICSPLSCDVCFCQVLKSFANNLCCGGMERNTGHKLCSFPVARIICTAKNIPRPARVPLVTQCVGRRILCPVPAYPRTCFLHHVSTEPHQCHVPVQHPSAMCIVHCQVDTHCCMVQNFRHGSRIQCWTPKPNSQCRPNMPVILSWSWLVFFEGHILTRLDITSFASMKDAKDGDFINRNKQ